MIHKNYAPGVTRVAAAELRGIADLLRTALRPGLVSLTNPALARPYKVNATTIGLGAFTSGDSIVTGGAVCTAYVTDRIDLATAGDGGGPLPAATYNLYLRVQRAGTAANRVFACYPMVTTGAGAYDVDDPTHADAFRTGQVNYTRPDVYLKLLAGITWDGTQITNAGSFFSNLITTWGTRNIWGCLDLTDVGRGTAAAVVIGNGRGLSVDQLLVDTFETNHLSILDNGLIECGDNVDVTFGNNPSIRFTGPVNEIIAEQGGLLFDLGTASEIRLGSGGLLKMLDGSLVEIAGDMDLLNGAIAQLAAGASLIGLQGSYIMAPANPAIGEPIANEVTGRHLFRALAVVDTDGTLLWGLNIDSVEVTGTGEYTVNFQRNISGSYGPLAQTFGAADVELGARAKTISAAYVVVQTFKHAVNLSGEHIATAMAAKFVLMIVGGTIS